MDIAWLQPLNDAEGPSHGEECRKAKQSPRPPATHGCIPAPAKRRHEWQKDTAEGKCRKEAEHTNIAPKLLLQPVVPALRWSALEHTQESRLLESDHVAEPQHIDRRQQAEDRKK